ncbi:MAG: Hpt domain-containing protein [Bacteroidetes bacterium]|nr:Hpt domain-containing protein [Bacteroidota bacterium]
MKHTDLSYLKELSNGSNQFMTEMITLFITQTPEALDSMEKHLKNKDWKLLRTVAHKIKPSISFVGLKEIESDIRTVEESAANETGLERLPDLISKINEVCNEGIKELKEELVNFS